MIAIDKNRRSRGCDLLCCCKRNTRIESLDPRSSRTSESDSSFLQVKNRYRPSPPSEHNSSDSVIIPGNVEATALKTVHSSSVVTFEVSAASEWSLHKAPRSRRDRQIEDPSDLELPAVGSIPNSGGVDTSKSGAGALANVTETQTEIEQGRRDPGNTRLCYQSQRTTRSSKIYPEQSASGNNFCKQSEAWTEGRHNSHGCTSRPATAVGSSSRDDRDARTQQSTDAPKKVTFTLPAKPASAGKTAVVMDDASSLRTLSSHSRSSPGVESMSRISTSQSMQECDSESECWCSFLKTKLQWLSLAYFARRYYGVWLQKMPVKVVVIIFFLSLLAVGIYGALQVESGLDLTDVVPRKGVEYKFVEARLKYFSFYPVALVTQDFDYANQQKKLLSYYNEFKNVRNYKLVSDDGIIRPEIFYKALTTWTNEDFLGYQFSQAVIKPKTVNWTNIKNKQNDKAMKVPTAKPITFANNNFNVIGLNETKDFVKLIEAVRKICDKYSDDGLPNYPSGVPFTFWEQYIWLRRQMLIAISISLAVSFVVMVIILFNIRAAAVIVLVPTMIIVEVYGFMGLAGIKVSAFPAVRVILFVGVGMEFTVHMSMAFFHALGDRNRRMQKAIEHAFAPTVNGAISSLLSVVVLAGSQFYFVFRYFFILHVALVLISTLNGVVFLPVVLSLAGPGPVVTEIPTPAITPNPLAIQNPSAVRYVYNEAELNTVKEVNNKSNDHGADLERTNENGAKVELSDNEPRSSDMTTGEGLRPFVLAWT
ncbi:protein patched homolog 1-like isoform X2 [Orbicella faveolata]|uniref:protein patched homolog 1-like isoform X2 n=1 Tax=Orbicella faveolata TaxID=48498 RepID=UPI0009E3D706|nr:protein patched homolog 1-like isoform X2 [Orbicella faveolata]